jgi:hypothetical protein
MPTPGKLWRSPRRAPRLHKTLVVAVLAAAATCAGTGSTPRSTRPPSAPIGTSPAPVFDRGRFAAVIPVPGASSIATADRVLWVHAAGRVVRIDPATNAVVGEPLRVSGYGEATIAVGEGVLWVASVAPGDLAGPRGDDRVIRIDPATGRRVATITVRWAPLDIAATPGAVWVTNSGDGDSVTRIDPETSRVAGRPVVTGASPQSLPVGGRVAVGGQP